MQYNLATFQTGVDFNMSDYDGRTALHLAVCGGNIAVVKFLVDKAKCNVNPLDRWNSTPLDDGYVTTVILYLYLSLSSPKFLRGSSWFSRDPVSTDHEPTDLPN